MGKYFDAKLDEMEREEDLMFKEAEEFQRAQAD